jgi:hypothetical protein
MTFLAWLAGRFPRRPPLCRGDRGRRPAARRLTLAPTVTLLEDRLAPALLTVNSLADTLSADAALTLREAIALVDSGGTATGASGNSLAAAKAGQIDTTNPFGTMDVIQFDPHLFGPTPRVITVVEGELLVDRSVAILGPGAGQLAVSGNNQSRVFEVAGGAAVTLSGLTIEAGDLALADLTGSGAGIINYGVLMLTDSIVEDGAAPVSGGGIANYGALTLTGSAVAGNAARVAGGIWNDGALTLVDSTVSGNVAQDSDGGIGSYGGPVTLTESAVVDNDANGAGGIGSYDGTVTLVDSTVSGNAAVHIGGLLNGAALLLSGSTVSDNTAQLDGGGLANYGTAALTGSTVSGNTALGGNGGIGNYAGALALTDSTVSGNTAGEAGGIGNYGGTLTLSDSTVVGNSAVDIGGILNDATLTLTGSTVSGNTGQRSDGGLANYGLLLLNGSSVTGNTAGWGADFG